MLYHDITRPMLVVTGVWNPAIFRPEWIAHHLLGKAFGDEVLLVEVHTNERRPPALYVGDYGVAVSSPRLDLFVNEFDVAHQEGVEALCKKLLDLLAHTPVNGLGVNHIFEVADVTSLMLDKIKTRENIATAFKVAEEIFITRIDLDGGVRLNLRREISSERIILDLNFHHNVASAQSVIDLLPGVVDRTYRRALEIINRLYEEHEVEHRGHKFPDAPIAAGEQ